MTPELEYLTWVTLLTAVAWLPYIAHMILTRGLLDAVGYPENPKPLAPWAKRMRAAHYNAVENLVVFATLVLIAHVIEVSNEVTIMAAAAYFWARLVHLFAYTFAVPWARTITFLIGFACQVALIWQILV